MGGERAREHEAKTPNPTVTPDPPKGGAAAGGTPPAAGGGGETKTSAVVSNPKQDDPQLLNWIKVIDAQDRSAALAQATSFCSYTGSGVVAMTTLDTANKSDAFYNLIKTSRPHAAADRALMGQLYARPIPYAHKVKLYQARYNIAITGATGVSFSEAELDTLWDSAASLPPGHVENNPRFTTLHRTANSATAEGSYGNPTINMREQANQARYAETFRHEVGHAIDASIPEVADLRLNQAGWTKYEALADYVKKVGYGTIDEKLQPKVLTAVTKYVEAGGPWDSPGKFEDELKKHVTDAADLKKVTDLFGSNTLLDTMRGSEGRYYGLAAVAKWPVYSGHAYFVNFYYHRVYSIAEATHTDLKARGNASACFSDAEWFAEMYQEWYKTATPGSGSFPAFVKTFFEKKVDPYVASSGAKTSGGGGHPRVPRG